MLVSEAVDFKPAQIAGGNNAADLATRIFGTKALISVSLTGLRF